MTKQNNPSLFGLKNSNRNFSKKESWGKNQFNSSFPAALCCYLHQKSEAANYLKIENGVFSHSELTIEDAFRIKPDSQDAYYAFESPHTPFQKYVIGTLPRTDLVIQNRATNQCLAGIEVKLTALPDNTTCDLNSDSYGSEIVVRPDTIVYLACSIAKGLGDEIGDIIGTQVKVDDWSDAKLVLPNISWILNSLNVLYKRLENKQSPFLLQPIGKTEGKSPQLSDQCLDVFFGVMQGLYILLLK